MARDIGQISVAHSLPGRVRMRVSGLRDEPSSAAAIADALASLPGVLEVRVRAFTGSVLCSYDDSRTTESDVVEATGSLVATEMARVAKPRRRTRARGSQVGRAVVEAFRELDADVREATEDRLDLGTVAALGFLVTGAVEVVSTRTLPAPPWFNLAWMAFRTLTVFETEADEAPSAQD